ncbi:hypothetical protein INS49_003686 [Diaporthe citri]|uniref:uncharacterized protein n=1 Tax=Diaporthe citri TaxID=83186 RepID=UPI001C7EF041|nr:uncharacterized protein INS49_003686 [Diaporthe citri]KAG6355722.1 hypothetical protein INS49_003686 [Diaporthe citri]
MAPFLVDPVSTFTLPERRKTKIHKTSHSSGSKLSKPAAIAIAVVVAVVLIAAIVASIIIQRRRKARSRANKHSSTLPGFSTDNGGGLYGRMPSYYAGSRDGGGQHQLHGGEAAQEKHPAGDYGDYGRASSSGYRVGDGGGGQGAAAEYYAMAGGGGGGGGGVQGQDYGRGSYEIPQRPPLAFNPSPAQV